MMEREEWLDVAKGIGIIMVVTQHFLGGKLGEWILMFHMPLFFFLSGYIFHAERYGSFSLFWRNKVRRRVRTYIWVSIPLILSRGGVYMQRVDSHAL
ncbi:MAG: acyltransferase family protein [Blautia sp.]|nr:acyltransferase family protein [Blautia sp.]MCM1200957.1 acyltransferase family protein [Bacteroides fragilis]